MLSRKDADDVLLASYGIPQFLRETILVEAH